MTRRRFKLSEPQTESDRSDRSTVAPCPSENTDFHARACVGISKATFKLVSYNNALNKKAFHPFEPGLNQGLPEAAKSARADGNAATVANLAIVYTEPAPVSPIVIAASVADFRIALAKFRASKPASAHFRHDQAWWAAEMFLNEWEILAVTFDWTVDDIFALPRGAKSGLAYWFGVEIVRALGPEHAVTEAGRVFDRITRLTWFQ